MRVNISGHHVIVSNPMREYVLSKLNRFERYSDQITKIDVTLIVEKMVQKAEASIHVAGADLFANAGHEDMYSAIDNLTNKLDRQIIKYKEKTQGKHRRDSLKSVTDATVDDPYTTS